MKNLLRAFALAGILAGFSTTTSFAGSGATAGIKPVAPATSAPGLYPVAQKLFAEGTVPVADVSVTSEASIQLVTITATAGACRVVLSDSDGQILRSRAVDGELDFDFYPMPTGTYRLAILDASGALAVQHTLVKR